MLSIADTWIQFCVSCSCVHVLGSTCTGIICDFLFSGDNGSVHFWDWRSGYNFQRLQTTVQPGSMDSEAGIFAIKFDKSGSRMFTCEADKTIKIYKEDETAVSLHDPRVNCINIMQLLFLCATRFDNNGPVLNNIDFGS